jgi:hypothetical protein
MVSISIRRNESSTEFPNGGRNQFPNALKNPRKNEPVSVKNSALWCVAGAGGIEPLKKGLWHKGFFNRNPRFYSIFDSFLPSPPDKSVGRVQAATLWHIMTPRTQQTFTCAPRQIAHEVS